MKNHGKLIQKSSPNRPQIHRVIDGSMDRSIDGSIPQIVEKSSKIAPKSTQNRRKSHPNRPQIGPKSPKIRPWDPMGTPGASQGTLGAKKVEKVSSRTPPRGSVWGHLGDVGRHWADIFTVFGCHMGGRRDDRRFDGQNVHTRTAKCA